MAKQRKSKCDHFMKENSLTILTLAGVIGGGVLGIVLRNYTQPWTPREIMYLQYPGELFLRFVNFKI